MPTPKGGTTNARRKSGSSGSDVKPTIDIFAAEGGASAGAFFAECNADTVRATISRVLSSGGFISFSSPVGAGDAKLSFVCGEKAGSKWVSDVRGLESALLAIHKALA